MSKSEVVLGISPARGGSKCIPRKNIIDLGGIPLIAHTIAQAHKSRRLTHYVVNSDDAEIRSVAESYGAETIDRPEAYSHDQILQEVDLLLRWTVEKYEERHNINVDIIVLLYPTAPLRDVESIDRAIGMVLEDGYDSCLSLYSDMRYLWKVNDDNTVEPTNYDPNKRMPRQKENWNQWAENKAVYVMRRDVLFKDGRIGDKCGFVEMDKWRSIDIDGYDDLYLARALLNSEAISKPL